MSSLFMTGGSGFIGRHFLRSYADQFSRIVLPLRNPPAFDLPDNVIVHTIKGSGQELAALLRANPCDHVLNGAAYGVAPTGRDAGHMIAVNIDMPEQLAKAAQDIGAHSFVQLGSMAEYRANASGDLTPETEDTLTDRNSYGGSKAEATRRLQALQPNGQTAITCLRLFGVFGPGEAPHRLLSALNDKLSAGQTVPMSAGTQVRDFIYIPDVTAAIFLALTRPVSPVFAVYNIGSGQGISVRNFAEMFCELGKYKAAQLDFGALPMRDTDVPFMVADISAAKAALDWSPQWTTSKALSHYLDLASHNSKI